MSPLYNVFFVDDTLDQQYLYYYLKSPVGLFYINELASGSVRDNLKFSILSEFNIPFPDLTIQKDIAITIDRIVQTINICNKILKVTSKNISPKAKKYGIIEPTNKVGDLDAVESICRR